MATLPYVTAPGNIDRALKAIQSAATPERVTQDFVKTILKIPGGSGDQMTSFLRKIGFSNADGAPTDIYKRFRNTSTSGAAAAEALRAGYAPLYRRNEYMHELSDEKLRGLIIEETGQQAESTAVGLALQAIKSIKKFANWGKSASATETVETPIASPAPLPLQIEQGKRSGVGLNLSYTINLNLPATSDIAVFNAIFKSLRDNLLLDENA
jgi:hypothetical protein